MRTFTRTSRTLFAPFALITSATVLLTACGSGTDGSTDSAGTSAKADKIPTTDVVSGVHKDEASAKLLPPGTRGLTVAFSVGGTPPGTTYLDDGKTLTGQDVDFANAVAKVLGIRLSTQQASFEAILPALPHAVSTLRSEVGDHQAPRG